VLRGRSQIGGGFFNAYKSPTQREKKPTLFNSKINGMAAFQGKVDGAKTEFRIGRTTARFGWDLVETILAFNIGGRTG
jgi:hypothetical protein